MVKKKANKKPQKLEPNAWAWRLLRAYLDPDVKASVTARCEAAKVDRKTFYRALKNPKFVAWFRHMLQESVISDMSDVRQSHLKLCLDGNLEAIKLWYEKYGDFVPSQRLITEDLSHLSDRELSKIQELLDGAGPAGESTQIH
ncbi:MAG: phBC6A51 family helix-turn-helix protein [Acidobacteriota bacterium]